MDLWLSRLRLDFVTARLSMTEADGFCRMRRIVLECTVFDIRIGVCVLSEVSNFEKHPFKADLQYTTFWWQITNWKWINSYLSLSQYPFRRRQVWTNSWRGCDIFWKFWLKWCFKIFLDYELTFTALLPLECWHHENINTDFSSEFF